MQLVDIIERPRVIGDETHLFRFGDDQGTPGFVVRNFACWNDLERDPPLIHQLMRGHDDVGVVSPIEPRISFARALRFSSMRTVVGFTVAVMRMPPFVCRSQLYHQTEYAIK